MMNNDDVSATVKLLYVCVPKWNVQSHLQKKKDTKSEKRTYTCNYCLCL